MAAVVTSGVSVSSEREITTSLKGVQYFTLPIADAIYGKVIAKYGLALTCRTVGDASTAMRLHLDAAWQEVTGLAEAMHRAKAVFPVGLPLRFGNVVPGFVLQLADEDARAFGCELSYVQPYGPGGAPRGNIIDGCFAVTERALWLALQQAGEMPVFTTLSESNVVDSSKTLSYGNLRDGVEYVRANGPVMTSATRTVNGKAGTVELPAFPSGGQREAEQAKVERARERANASSRLAAIMGV